MMVIFWSDTKDVDEKNILDFSEDLMSNIKHVVNTEYTTVSFDKYQMPF